MKVRLTMDWLLHRRGDVITVGMESGHRLISRGRATLYAEADEMLTQEELVIAPKAIEEPQDKMARPKIKKAVRKKRKKAKRAARRQPAREPVTQD